MKFFNRIILLAFLLLAFNKGFATSSPISKDSLKQVPIPPDSFRVKYFTGELFQNYGIKETFELKDFQKYSFRSYLGNIGQPVYDYYADQPIRSTGFNYFKNDFAKNLTFQDSIRYYDAHQPYTKLFFLSGQKKEVDFNFIHSQNINKNLNFTAYFSRIRSDGTYLRQNTNLTSLYLSSNYKSSNRRYYMLANVVFNVDKPLVNGGLKSDSTFEHTGATDYLTLPVNLVGAQRKYRNRQVSLHQFFNLGYVTLPADSTLKSTFTPTSAFSFNTTASDDAITYYDSSPDSGFYKNHYISDVLTHDSVYFYKIINSVGWNTYDVKHSGARRKTGLFLNVSNELIRVNQLAGDRAFMNWILKGGVFNYKDSAADFRIKLNAEYVFSGYNSGDYRMDLKLEEFFLHHKLSVGASLIASDLTPDYMNLVYSSNNFKWNNNFGKETLNSAKLFVRSPGYGFEIGAFARQNQNMVYYDVTASPIQLRQEVDVAGAYLYKELRFGNWNFNNRITWQHSSDLTVLQFPEWVSEHSLFFRHHLQHKLTYQVGVDVFFFSSYFGNNYMPATGQFYVQTEKKIGNYPFADFYVSMQIKTVRIFVKYEHINSGYPSFTYYLATHQPAPDRALKLGLAWIFNN
jgi:hypothetical protein